MRSDWSVQDVGFMKRALALAATQIGRTGESPSVGCVIVRDGVIIGEGVTGDSGRPHGEAMALMNAGPRVLGGTAYVTLEPCNHHSARGPTCSLSLIAAGIHRVVCCMQDPDPRTAGQGFTRLRSAGIQVDVGLLAEDASVVMADFLARLGIEQR
jgi:diaminohydroxyphosphoribosylaminopyrimidine deaminase / 5-amino-6-(5-phosphoribosylamino)uracil reductase